MIVGAVKHIKLLQRYTLCSESDGECAKMRKVCAGTGVVHVLLWNDSTLAVRNKAVRIKMNHLHC